MVTIEFLTNEKSVELEVVNTLGQVTIREQLVPVEGMHYKSAITVKNLASGVYTLKNFSRGHYGYPSTGKEIIQYHYIKKRGVNPPVFYGFQSSLRIV